MPQVYGLFQCDHVVIWRKVEQRHKLPLAAFDWSAPPRALAAPRRADVAIGGRLLSSARAPVAMFKHNAVCCFDHFHVGTR